MFPGSDLYCADPAQPLTTAREELDDPHHDLSDLSEACNRQSKTIAHLTADNTFFASLDYMLLSGDVSV